MNTEELNKIYDELNGISVQIEPRSIPNPRYISEKIGECHVCIEKVEKIYIKANKELSVYQIALNNAIAAYEIARDELISNDPDTKNLPNAKDRESKANTKLKDQINEINSYKQSLQSTETLVKTLTMKLRNLTRLNGDIRLQMKIMESQIRLGTGDINDPTTKSLMDELKKTLLGQDVWEGAETKSEENSIMDPSKPINANDLMSDFEKSVENMISESDVSDTPNLIDESINNDLLIQGDSTSNDPSEPVNMSAPYYDPIILEPASSGLEDLLSGFKTEVINNPPKQEDQIPINNPPKQEDSVLSIEDSNDFISLIPDDDIDELDPSEEDPEEASNSKFDLNKVLDVIETFSSPEKGGSEEPKKEEPTIIKEPEVTQPLQVSVEQKEEPKNPNDMLFNSLLSQFK